MLCTSFGIRNGESHRRSGRTDRVVGRLATILRLPAAGKVLLAEDDADIAEMYRMGLEHAGFVVIIARDGADALRVAAARSDTDVMVLDLTMPCLDGLDILARLRHAGVLDQMPVIVLSNRVQDFPAALSAGATHCMAKALTTPTQLVNAVSVVARGYARGA